LVVRYNTPIINGIVVTDTLQDAEERITGKLDRGHEFAQAAIEMGNLQKKWTKI
jgi:6,7-dimethyl-8-ribityllumazine synthase